MRARRSWIAYVAASRRARRHDGAHGHHPGPGPRVVTPENAGAGSLLERFTAALEAVRGVPVVVRNEAEASAAVARIIREKSAHRVAVSSSDIVERVVGGAGLDHISIERNTSHDVLFDCDLGVTGAQWAIAETGTLVLEADRERHRLASLVPPVHIAIVEGSRLRETLGELLEILSADGKDALSRCVTFITGPSRTSDIELILTIGVHGPGELYVVLLDRPGAGHHSLAG